MNKRQKNVLIGTVATVVILLMVLVLSQTNLQRLLSAGPLPMGPVGACYYSSEGKYGCKEVTQAECKPEELGYWVSGAKCQKGAQLSDLETGRRNCLERYGDLEKAQAALSAECTETIRKSFFKGQFASGEALCPKGDEALILQPPKVVNWEYDPVADHCIVACTLVFQCYPSGQYYTSTTPAPSSTVAPTATPLPS